MLCVLFSLFSAPGTGLAQEDQPVRILITNVNIFDGMNEALVQDANVLVEGNLIKSTSTSPIDAPGAEVINGDGRTLMPGLIDAHWHMIKLMAKKDVWLSIQPILNDEDAIPFPPGSVNQMKFEQVTQGTDKVYALAKKHKVKTAFGTDVIFDPELCKKHGKLLAKLKRWYTPYEALKMATHDNAQLLKMCGPRDPYPGDLGVVKEGALADLIMVDGNPLENLDLVADPESNFVMIMKDGVIYKNTLE